jgi:flagellar assembly protein FliH
MALIKNSIAASMARDAIVLDLGDLRAQADAIIVTARQQAGDVIARGKAEAAQLIAAADQRGLAEGLERGRADGLAEGQARGRQEILDQLAPQLQALLAKWTTALEQWEHDRDDLLMAAREEVLAFAVAMGEKLTARIADIDPTVVEDQLAEALALLTRPSSVTVTIHPKDRAVVEPVLPELMQRLGQCKHVQWAESADVGRGGCVITSAGGRIDATLRTRIDRIVAALLPDPGRRLPDPEQPKPSEP